MIMTLEELAAALETNVDEIWFVNYFEIDIKALVERFPDLIAEKKRDLPFDLGLTERPLDYEDR